MQNSVHIVFYHLYNKKDLLYIYVKKNTYKGQENGNERIGYVAVGDNETSQEMTLIIVF